MNDSVKRVFVVGCPRSGTTLVQRILANHSDLISFPETGFYRQLCGNRIWTRVAELGLIRRSRFQRASGRFKRVLSHLEPFPIEIKPGPLIKTSTASDWLCGQLDAIARKTGHTGWVEKTPLHYRATSVITKTIVNAKVIYVLRDGPSVLGSIRDRATKYPKQFGDQFHPHYGVKEWNRSVETAWRHRCTRSVGLVFLNDILEKPDSVAKRLAEFAGVDYEENMMAGRPRHGIVQDNEPWKDAVGAPIQRPEEKFKALFEPPEQRSVEKQLELEKFEQLRQYAL